jgi:hypothetical protein
MTLLGGRGHSEGRGIMTEASGDGSRAEVERRLIDRSLQDEEFRQRLLAGPRAAIEQELGSRLAESVEVRVVEETKETIYLVLPSASPLGQGGEISDEGLDAVSGADWGDSANPIECFRPY